MSNKQTLKEELKIDSDDETMKVSEQIEKEIQKDENLKELPASFEEEPTSSRFIIKIKLMNRNRRD